MNVNVTTMKKADIVCPEVSTNTGGKGFQSADGQWEENSCYLQKLVGELMFEMTPLIQKLEEQLDDDWDRFQEHRGEFARSFLAQLRAFSSTSYKNPDQFYQSVKRIASMWATLSKAQRELKSRTESHSASPQTRKYANL